MRQLWSWGTSMLLPLVLGIVGWTITAVPAGAPDSLPVPGAPPHPRVAAGLDPPAVRPPDVILLVADGAGYSTWAATSMFQGRWDREHQRSRGQVYDDRSWVQLAKSVWSAAGIESQHPRRVDPNRVYDPAKAWDARPIGAGTGIPPYPDHFAGYQWHKAVKPDSASTMTQMMTGAKTYDGAINYDLAQRPLTSYAELCKEQGYRVGVVTSVPIGHATAAAAGGAHNVSRQSYAEIANDLLLGNTVDLLMGCGHPYFGVDGGASAGLEPTDFTYVGGRASWQQLVAGRHSGGWRLVTERHDFDQLRKRGCLSDGSVPERLLGVFPVRETLQMQRPAGTQQRVPWQAPKLETVPDLRTAAIGALEWLTRDTRPLFLVVEGGAVDWAMHANKMSNLLEEMVDFNLMVEAVCEWLTRHQRWSSTLVVITADHDHLLFGPAASVIPFQLPEDRGPGHVPGHSWHNDSHSNQLVPLFARGVHADRFRKLADQVDPIRGPYLDDTEVFQVLRSLLPPVPANDDSK